MFTLANMSTPNPSELKKVDWDDVIAYAEAAKAKNMDVRQGLFQLIEDVDTRLRALLAISTPSPELQRNIDYANLIKDLRSLREKGSAAITEASTKVQAFNQQYSSELRETPLSECLVGTTSIKASDGSWGILAMGNDQFVHFTEQPWF